MQKKKYNSQDYSTRTWIEEMVIKGVKEGNLKQYFSGIDSNYRIQDRDTYDKTLTDTYYLIVSGLYPVYLKYGYDLNKLTRQVLEDMISGGNTQEFCQVYRYVSNELKLRDDYTDLPFVVADKELIYKMKEANAFLEWKSLEKTNEVFANPDAFFCDEYIKGGRKGYVYIADEEDEDYQRRIEECIEKEGFREYLRGTKEEYRILGKGSQRQNISDITYFLNHILYPLYSKGHHNIKEIIRSNIEEMLESGDSIDFYQAYHYLCSETDNIMNYCNLPYIVSDKSLISRAKKRRLEMEASLKETPIRRLTAWEITGNMERNYDAFSKTEEFFKEYF